MGLFDAIFAKNPRQLLERGDRLLENKRYFDARSSYEDALAGFRKQGADNEQIATCCQRIDQANRCLAQLNIDEATHLIRRGDQKKAAEHLELAKSLSNDQEIHTAADQHLARLEEIEYDTPADTAPESASGCSSCSSGSCSPPAEVAVENPDADLPLLVYYELLIQQLPSEVKPRYAQLGEDFAALYVEASKNNHEEALQRLEAWNDPAARDIYFYEKGMCQYRMGRVREAEASFRYSIKIREDNSLAYIGLVLLLLESRRLPEADVQLDHMISQGYLPEQATLFKAEIRLAYGETDHAIELFSSLIKTPYERQAATRLHETLIHCGRDQEAAYVLKTYLGGCCH